VDSRGLVSEHVISSGDQWAEYLKGVPPCENIREIYLRADSGFYDSDFMDYLEQKGISYTIVVKLYPWIQMELVGLNYRDIGGGICVRTKG